jgi:hypothetical protein
VIIRGWWVTDTVKLHIVETPLELVAVQITVLMPMGKIEPDGVEQDTVALGEAVGAG